MGFLTKTTTKDDNKKLKEELETLKKQVADSNKKKIKDEEATPEELSLDEDIGYESEEGDNFDEEEVETEEEKDTQSETKEDPYTLMGKYFAAALDVYISEMTTDGQDEKKS